MQLAQPFWGDRRVHNPETHLIPNAIQAAQGKGPELVVFGKNHEADGSCIRDYVHVCDLATHTFSQSKNY